MHLAKKRRQQKFTSPLTGRGILLPVDHGLTVGPLPGISSVRKIADLSRNPNVNAVIAHKGVIERLLETENTSRVGLILHLNGASTLGSEPNDKTTLTSLETALALGVDGVSIQLNFTDKNSHQCVEQLGRTKDAANSYGLPLLLMLYDKVQEKESRERVERMRHLLRISLELGADMVKIGFPSRAGELSETLKGIAADLPVFLAGGDVGNESQFLRTCAQGLRDGARGFCVGRNVFEAKNPAHILAKLAALVSEDAASAVRHFAAYGA
jgi:class I fructose-bisphosphate aldolase/fructose-bisphosphate aldolase/2-amino-3,7-dideoxy-D-threo-hept-6-ulosonate synthase